MAERVERVAAKSLIIIADNQSVIDALSFALPLGSSVRIVDTCLLKRGKSIKSDRGLKIRIQRLLASYPDAFVLLCVNEADLGYLIWHVIRINSKNPIVALDVLDRSVIAERHPLFKAPKKHNVDRISGSHIYIQIPGVAKQLAVAVQTARPFAGNLDKLWRDFSNELGYIRWVVHLLKGPDSGRPFFETRAKLEEALDYFERMQNREIVEAIQKWLSIYKRPTSGWEKDAGLVRDMIDHLDGGDNENNPLY